MQLIYEITKLPDLSLSKYQMFADSGVDGMLSAQTQFIRQLHRVMMLGEVSFHFLFVYDPSRQAGHKLRSFIFFDGSKENYKEKLQKVIAASGISEYFYFHEIDTFPEIRKFPCLASMHKRERFLETELNREEVYFYVVPNWELNDTTRLYNLVKLMQSFEEPACYRVDLFTEDHLEEKIHKNFEKPLSYLRNISNQEQGISEFSRNYKEKRDPNADETLHQYEEWLKSVDTNPMFRANVSVMSDDSDYSQILLDSVVSEILKSGDADIQVEEGSFLPFSGCDVCRTLYSEDAPGSMREWTTTYTVEEAAALARFPVLYDGETIELPKETAAILNNEGFVIGHDMSGYPVSVSEKALPKHMFICGVPGSGKTNTMLHLADSLWNGETVIDGIRKKAHIPFLVLEPAKKEYRELCRQDIPELIIFSPSANTRFPIQINPFEFPRNLTLSEHINAICKVFEGAFPIAPPAPFILDKAVQAIYEHHGWNVKDVNHGDKEYPTVSELYSQFEHELEATTYDSEIRGNIQSVLQMRIGSLLRREMKEIFDVPSSSLAPEEWLKRPVVIELEALGEGPANFLTLLLCTLIRETLKADPYGDKNRVVRHVIFLEEAHNLIAEKTQTDDPMNSNPKIAATAFIVKMLAEVRALREGIIIADQLPSAMAPEVMKNTNIKLVHRLTAQDDRELVGSTMSASALQLESMATYTQGRALFSYEKLLRPFEMQVCEVKSHQGTGADSEHLDDSLLYEVMKKKAPYRAFREQEEERKFLSIREQVQKVLALEAEKCRVLRKTDLVNMSLLEFQNWAYASQTDLIRFQSLRKIYSACLMQINMDFFDNNRVQKLLDIANIISCGFASEMKKKCKEIEI